MPSEPDAPDAAYEKAETRERVRAAIQSLPWRERKVIGLYYYGEVTMKQIGAEIGVNESRVSQLHARAIRRLRDALGDMNPQKVAEMRRQLIAFTARKPTMVEGGHQAVEGHRGNDGGDRGCSARGRAPLQARQHVGEGHAQAAARAAGNRGGEVAQRMSGHVR